MIIEELLDGGGRVCEKGHCEEGRRGWLAVDPKRAAVGVGARILFYPSVVYNVLRNRLEPDFHWWDLVDEHVLLGAVPFPSDVPRLKDFGISGVVTLTEPYETLVPTSLYDAYGIENLVLPTRDYLYAPSFGNLCKGVDFIHKNALNEKTTYVHCKAGRGRSTTVVLCYLVQYKNMTPFEAYAFVRLRRPRILLASSQWQAVQDFYQLRVKRTIIPRCINDPRNIKLPPFRIATHNVITFDDSTMVVISESDLEGYDPDSGTDKNANHLVEVSIIYRVQLAKKAALARLSYLWFQHRSSTKDAAWNLNKLQQDSCSAEVEIPRHFGEGRPCLLQGVVVN